MKGSKTVFVCRVCGCTSPKWLGKCPDCSSWDPFDEEEITEKSQKQQLKEGRNKNSDKAEKILAEHAPASLKEQCGDIAKIHHRLDVAALLIEELIKENKLIVPNEKTPLCIWGVKN